MSAGPMSLVEVLNRRLQVVREISSAQSRKLFSRQVSGGAEFELQQIEQEIAVAGSSHALVKALEEARERLQTANAALAVCDADCAALELRLEELDRWVSAAVDERN